MMAAMRSRAPRRRSIRSVGFGGRSAVLRLEWVLATALLAGCSHPPKHEIVLKYDQELSLRLGRAKKADILDLLGEPQVRDLLGDAEVWVYQYDNSDKAGKGRPEVKLVAPDHDELMLSFDREGVLQKYNVIMEGRTTKRGRGGPGEGH